MAKRILRKGFDRYLDGSEGKKKTRDGPRKDKLRVYWRSESVERWVVAGANI